MTGPPRPVLSTYRLQLGPGFGFADATAVVGYLARLGVSHLYLSPCFEATPGSTHGYDVTDPGAIRAELGGGAGFRRLVREAHRHGLGLVLDIVPHHLAAAPENRWWWDVLTHGQESRFAGHFDVDWTPPDSRLAGKVLLPVLGDHYGRELAAGRIRLVRGAADAVEVRYQEHRAPLSAASIGDLPVDVEEVNTDEERLHAVLEAQHHRLARWRLAAYELDYRRFFDIDSLVAVRSERATVFRDMHRLALRLVEEGSVDGLRVDHVDGLRDPTGYLERLRGKIPAAWLVVEKILRPGERLPGAWPVDGTTGYDFLAMAGGLFVEPEGATALQDSFAAVTGDTSTYDEVALTARREVLDGSLRADLERVVAALGRFCEAHRRWRDYSRVELREALTEVALCTPVYRTYSRPGHTIAPDDAAVVDAALARAAASKPQLDADLLGLLRSLLLGAFVDADADAMLARFQQLTGPLTAKGEEDTAFYRWVPFLPANEVGAEPDLPATSVDAFHSWCTRVAERWPATMLTTSSHDTKRSEDVRCRLAALSECPGDAAESFRRWDSALGRGAATAVDAATHWYVFQTLVGAHPLPVERAWVAVLKAIREAGTHTSWTDPVAAYEAAVEELVERATSSARAAMAVAAFAEPLVAAGRRTSLALTALRLTAPGVPDNYQGCELWDDSLVDPDNRRPVDFSLREHLLATLGDADLVRLWRREAGTGVAKLALIHALLSLRRRRPDGLGPGAPYAPLEASGSGRERIVTFLRGDAAIAVAVARLTLRSMPDRASVRLPAGRWRNVLTGQELAGGAQPFRLLRDRFPVAILERL